MDRSSVPRGIGADANFENGLQVKSSVHGMIAGMRVRFRLAYHKEDEYSFVPSRDCISDGGPKVGQGAFVRKRAELLERLRLPRAGRDLIESGAEASDHWQQNEPAS
jgi:hypothetical protein